MEKIIISLEFKTREEAAEFLMGAPKTAKATATITPPTSIGGHVNHVAPQEFVATQQPVAPAAMSPIEKARATKAANAAKKAAEAAAVAPASTVPTTAFPSAPAQPLNPMPPAPPQGMPMPQGMQAPAINYGAPMNAPAPMNFTPPAPQQQAYQAPVAPPVQQQAQQWDKVRVVAELQATAEASGVNPDTIRGIFGSIFQENGITPGPLGQLSDQDVYKFQLAFYPKLQQAKGNGQNLI